MKIAALTLSAALLTLGAVPAQAARGHNRWSERQDAWKTLGVLRTTGNDDTLLLDRRTGQIDDLRIEATRGTVNLRSVIVTMADGQRFVLPVHQQVRPGNAQFVSVPAAASASPASSCSTPVRAAGSGAGRSAAATRTSRCTVAEVSPRLPWNFPAVTVPQIMKVWRRAFTRKRLEARRLDLTAVASRYLGETEANLYRPLAQASDTELALLLDEAEALFGRRSDVQESHDRYRGLQESSLVAGLKALFAQQQGPR